jgi:hypothetical protein
VIKLTEIEIAPLTTGETGFVAHVDVMGHGQTLICEVKENAQPHILPEVLQKLNDGAAYYDESATPVLIAPHFSPEAQTLCKESHASFLDLEGNAPGDGRRRLYREAVAHSAQPASRHDGIRGLRRRVRDGRPRRTPRRADSQGFR